MMVFINWYAILILGMCFIACTSNPPSEVSSILPRSISLKIHSGLAIDKKMFVIRGGKVQQKESVKGKQKNKHKRFGDSFRLRFKKFLRTVLAIFLDKECKVIGRENEQAFKLESDKSISCSSKDSEKIKTTDSQNSNARIHKEIQDFLSNPPDNCKLLVGSNVRHWVIIIKGADGTIYEGEKFKLRMVFPKDYPSKPPIVYFLKPCPKHVHVYSNGDICLNLLGRDWRPSFTAQSIPVSILSMLSSAKEKKIPPDNALHSDAPPGQAQDNFMYHDDRC